MGLLLGSFHLIMAIHYIFACYSYFFDIHPPKEYLKLRAGIGGPFKFLTCWNLVFQTIFFILAVIIDLTGSTWKPPNKRSFLQKIKDFYYGSIVFSLGACVSIAFWTLYAINRELIFPKVLDTFFPMWLNHSIHTMPLVGILVEMMLYHHHYPSHKRALLALSIVMVSYGSFVLYIAYATGFWVYPVLQKLTLIGRVAFISGMCILGFVFFMMGDYLNRFVWKKRAKLHAKKIN